MQLHHCLGACPCPWRGVLHRQQRTRGSEGGTVLPPTWIDWCFYSLSREGEQLSQRRWRLILPTWIAWCCIHPPSRERHSPLPQRRRRLNGSREQRGANQTAMHMQRGADETGMWMWSRSDSHVHSDLWVRVVAFDRQVRELEAVDVAHVRIDLEGRERPRLPLQLNL